MVLTRCVSAADSQAATCYAWCCKACLSFVMVAFANRWHQPCDVKTVVLFVLRNLCVIPEVCSGSAGCASHDYLISGLLQVKTASCWLQLYMTRSVCVANFAHVYTIYDIIVYMLDINTTADIHVGLCDRRCLSSLIQWGHCCYLLNWVEAGQLATLSNLWSDT